LLNAACTRFADPRLTQPDPTQPTILKTSGGSDTASAAADRSAQALLRWMAGYVSRHGLTEFGQEAELARELAGLLDQREQLLLSSQVEQLAAAVARVVR
jgi:hypothetical protein